MTIDLTTITVMNDIRERLLAITEEEFAWALRQLETTSPANKKDKVLGEITNPATRALYVLAMRLSADSKLERGKADASLDPIMEDEHSRQSVLLNDLADVAREMFWAQSKLDLGHYKATCLGVRAKFVLIQNPREGESMFPSFLRGFAGGSTSESPGEES